MTKGPKAGNVGRFARAWSRVQLTDPVRKLSSRRRRGILWAIVMVSALACSSVSAQRTPVANHKKVEREPMVLPGVIVEKVDKGSAAEQAGIKKGDVILSWSRGDEGGKVDTPFVKSYVSLQQLYFGNVVMRGLHGGDEKKWDLGENDNLGIDTRPNFKSHVLRMYLACEDLRQRNPSKATSCFDKAAEHGMGQINFSPFVWMPCR